MTRVDFYLLSLPQTDIGGDDSQTRVIETVCKLIEKAVRQNKTVFINTETPEMAEQIDCALWEFKAETFIPHRILSSLSTPGLTRPLSISDRTPALHEDRVEIACGVQPLPLPGATHEVLINLAENVPPFFSRFERTLEVVGADELQRSSSRKRYTYYKERGYPLKHHNLG